MTSTALVRTGEPEEPRALAGLAPMSFEQVVLMGDALVRTGFLPEHIKNGAQAAAIILTGQEMGMPPMRALRSLAMVKGKVTEYADSQLARFKADGGHAVWRRLDEVAAILFLRHPNGDEHEEQFTLEDAERAGLTKAGRNGEPSMYHKHPKAMLRSRAITAGLKSIGWEGGVGAYDPEEALTFSASSATASADANGVSQDPTDRADDQHVNAGGPSAAAEPECPKCGGRMWDNRVAKRNPKAPDFKCRSRSCDGVIFPPRPGEERPAAAPAFPGKPAGPTHLEEALAFPLPGGAKAWGGKGGTPLGELSSKMLESVQTWAKGKVDAAEAEDQDADPRLVQLLAAAKLALPTVKAQEEFEAGQEKLALEEGPAAAGSGGPVSMPPGGKVQDALDGAADPATLTQLAREIGNLLKDEKLSNDERAQYRTKLEAATTVEQLQALNRELMKFLDLPF